MEASPWSSVSPFRHFSVMRSRRFLSSVVALQRPVVEARGKRASLGPRSMKRLTNPQAMSSQRGSLLGKMLPVLMFPFLRSKRSAVNSCQRRIPSTNWARMKAGCVSCRGVIRLMVVSST